jgi:hypothetical protein
MRWKAKRIPKDGETRWTLIFAWIPRRCNDGYMRWLCDLYVRQVYAIYGECAGNSWVSVEYSTRLPAHLSGSMTA